MTTQDQRAAFEAWSNDKKSRKEGYDAFDIWQAAIEHDRKGRGEPVAWPRNAKEIRDFIDTHFISMTGGDEASDDDKYLLTAHDLLSAFDWWTDFAPQPAELVQLGPTEHQSPEKFKMRPAEPVKVPNDVLADLDAVIERQQEFHDTVGHFSDDPELDEAEYFAVPKHLRAYRALLSRYQSAQPGASVEPVAWMVPSLATFKDAIRTDCPPDVQEKLEGTVLWSLSIVGDMPPVTDKHGVTHYPRALVYRDSVPTENPS